MVKHRSKATCKALSHLLAAGSNLLRVTNQPPEHLLRVRFPFNQTHAFAFSVSGTGTKALQELARLYNATEPIRLVPEQVKTIRTRH